jgi:hypothetical protein
MGRIARREHVVQFYEDDGFLAETVARFLGAGIGAGDNVIVVARGSNLTRFRETLAANAFDLDGVVRSRQLTMLDAEETLELLMDGDMPDVGRFLDVIGGVLFRTSRARPKRFLRAYGEMVDVLWRRGNRRAAIALEGLWNELAREHEFSLLCGYAIQNFDTRDDSFDFDAVCWAHTEALTQRAGTSS